MQTDQQSTKEIGIQTIQHTLRTRKAEKVKSYIQRGPYTTVRKSPPFENTTTDSTHVVVWRDTPNMPRPAPGLDMEPYMTKPVPGMGQSRYNTGRPRTARF